MRVIRFSGLRLENNYTYQAQFQTIVENATIVAEKIFVESLKEPYLYYDTDRNKSIKEIIAGMLNSGEIFLPYVDDKLIGYASLRNVTAGKAANLEIFLLPEYRKQRILGEFHKILYDAAFSAFPKGLQLLKVRATVHPDNKASLTGCKNVGFVQLITLPFEGLFSGAITNMLYLELYPKEVRKLLKPEEITNHGSTTQSGNPDSLRGRADNIKSSPKLRKQSAKLPKHKPESDIQPDVA